LIDSVVNYRQVSSKTVKIINNVVSGANPRASDGSQNVKSVPIYYGSNDLFDFKAQTAPLRGFSGHVSPSLLQIIY